MEALGFMLDNEGIVLYPDGDPSFTANEIVVEGSKAEENMDKKGQVTFQGAIDSDISETCFIEVQNTTTGQIYLINLYNVNKYSRTVWFPEGEYIPLAGGIYNDYTNKYPFESEGFTVKNGSFSFVIVKVGMSKSEKEQLMKAEEIQMTEETQEEQLESLTAESIQEATERMQEKHEVSTSTEESKTTNKSSIFTGIWSAILVVLGLGGFILYKWYKKKNI